LVLIKSLSLSLSLSLSVSHYAWPATRDAQELARGWLWRGVDYPWAW